MVTILLFLTGILLYSFLEYAVHRWLLHGPMSKLHSEHHRDPDKQLSVPFKYYVPAFLVLWLVAGFWLMLGTAVGWYLSSKLHDELHHGHSTARWKLGLWKHHNGHHAKVTTNYGVSSVVWDKLFRTAKPW